MTTKKHILMTGGGTMGPVTPLLALASAWKKTNPEVQISWVGTPQGPEAEIVRKQGMMFHTLSSPKFDRGRFWKLLFVLPHFLVSCIQAYILLRQIKPDIIFTAGGYVSVPVVIVARFMKIPSWVHQLDVQVGLANKIMAPFAKKITVTWEKSAKSFSASKTKVVGGLVRPEILEGQAEKFAREFGLDSQKSTVFVTGGGTGALAINNAMEVIGAELSEKMNVIHLTGKGKMIRGVGKGLEKSWEGVGVYIMREFFTDEMAGALKIADVVVSRAGMGTILELAALKKPSILIPIPGTHQEKNARILEEKGAVKVIRKLNPQILKQEIVRLIESKAEQNKLSRNIGLVLPITGAERIVREAEDLIK